MTALQVYRDDGPLAEWIGRTAARAMRIDEVTLTLLAAVPFVAALAASAWALPAYAVGVAALAFVLLAGAASGGADARPLTSVVPPILRAAEYAFLMAVTMLAEPDAMPLCFAFLAVVAFHHYDTVYRLRHQRAAPPRWVRAVSGGWDGRLLVAYVLALAGVLRLGFLAGAVVLALVYAAESTVSWLRFGRAKRPAEYEDEDEDDLVE